MTMSCGIDWSEDHHDVAVVDANGHLVAKRRIGDDGAGFAQLPELPAEARDRLETPIPVAIETARVLLKVPVLTARELWTLETRPRQPDPERPADLRATRPAI
jgi:hypothetical protein